MPGVEVVAVSAKTGARARRAAGGARRAADARPSADDAPDAAVRRPRVHAARDRHRRDRNALVGVDRRRRRAARRAGGPRRARSQRAGARPRRRSAPRPDSASRSPCRASSASELRRGDALVEPGAYTSSYRLDIALEELAAIPTHACSSTTAPRRCLRASCASATVRAASARRARRRGARRPRRAARRHDGRRRARHRSRPAAPRRASSVASSAAHAARCCTVRADAAHLAERRRLGMRRLGLRASGSTSFVTELRAAARRGRSARPGHPARRRSRGRRRSSPRLGLERRGAKLYRPGREAALGERERRGGELEAKLGLDPVKVESPALARFLEEQGRLVRVGDGYAVSSACVRRRPAKCSSTSSRPRDDHARPLPRPARLAQDGAAAARALRRRRRHAPRRRRARATRFRPRLTAWLPREGVFSLVVEPKVVRAACEDLAPVAPARCRDQPLDLPRQRVRPAHRRSIAELCFGLGHVDEERLRRRPRRLTELPADGRLGQEHLVEAVTGGCGGRTRDLEHGRRVGVAAVVRAGARRLRGEQADELADVLRRRRVEAAQAAAREDDVRPVVEGSLHEVPLASHPVAPAVDRARTHDRRRTSPFSSRIALERDLLRRVRPVTGLDGRLGLRNRNGEFGEVVDSLGLVERPPLVVCVHGSARDRDQRSGVEPEQLLRVCSLEGR